MANRRRAGASGPVGRLPQLVASIAGSLVAFTGAWLWWLGDDITGRVVLAQEITDPYTVQVWMVRLHRVGAFVLIAVASLLAVQAIASKHGWRFVFSAVFVVFLIVGAWSGYTADWAGAREWSISVGTKLTTALDLTDGPPLPNDLQRARVHLLIVPAALLIVGFASFDHYRRS